MAFLSVVPAVRTPFGVDCFDYQIPDESILREGDVIRVPFRNRLIDALVIRRGPTSAFAAKAAAINPEPLIRIGSDIVQLLERTSQKTFSSQPTIFASWIRTIPKRAVQIPEHNIDAEGASSLQTIYTATRFASVLEHARSSTNRTLIITPWKQRADAFAALLKCDALHADVADGAAWRAWSSFVGGTSSHLVVTRVGAWLACVADTIILDEPENDDHKQDELSPRIDARWLAQTTQELHPKRSLIRVSTTPCLSSLAETQSAPSIDTDLTIEPWQRGSRTELPHISPNALAAIEDAITSQRSVTILHPIKGDRSRVHCRDCGWVMTCGSCAFPLSAETTQARCYRCGKTEALPQLCPSCQGADLTAARTGKDRLAKLVTERFGNAVTVVDLSDWHKLTLPKQSLVLVTDLSLIGGYVEDIRRRERLIISWRRLAAAIAQSQSSLYVQGSESTLNEARGWLSADGLQRAWQQEWNERASFSYPPVARRIKLLVDGTESAATELMQRMTEALQFWTIEGPYPVAYRSASRSQRHVLHLLPPPNMDGKSLYTALEPFAREAIIDLDPIAFFS